MGDLALDKSTAPAKRNLLQVLGPALITGAADDDPSGIATYSFPPMTTRDAVDDRLMLLDLHWYLV